MRLHRTILVVLAAALIPSLASAATLSWTSSGPGGGGAFASPSISVNGSVIIGSDLGGAYHSTDGGASWSPIGVNDGLLSTHVDVVVHHPSIDGMVFLGTSNGVYRSTNCDTSPAGNCTFTQTLVPDTDPPHLITALGIASSGTASATTLYAAGIEHWCLNAKPYFWRSTDNGATWNIRAATGLPPTANIMAIRVKSNDPGTIIVISAESRFTQLGCGSTDPKVVAPNAAYISTNGGTSFTPLIIPTATGTCLTNADDSAYVEDVKFDKVKPRKLWATVTANPLKCADSWDPDGELWMSTGNTCVGCDFVQQSGEQTGQIWPLSTGDIRVIDLRRQHPWDTKRGVWQWSPANSTWTQISGYDNWETGWSGKVTTHGSSLNGSLHTITPVDDATLLWADSQFGYSTADGGQSFQQAFTNAFGTLPSYVSRRLDNTVPLILAPSPVVGNQLYAGYLDVGCWASANARGATPKWTDCNGPKSDQNPLPSDLNGNWYGYGGNTTAIAPDPTTAGVVWAVHFGACNNVQDGNCDTPDESKYKIMKSTDSGATWTEEDTYDLAALTNNQPITDLLVEAPTPTTRRLWAIAGNQLWKLGNGSTNWQNVATPCDYGLMFLAKQGAIFLAGGSAGLCYSANSGATWAYSDLTTAFYGPEAPTWWDCSNLHRGVSDIAFDPTNNQVAWLTVIIPDTVNDVPWAGLFKTTNGGAHWTQVSSFAPAPFGRNFTRTVAVSPIDSNIIIVGTSPALACGGYRIPTPGDSDSGTWVSRDGGASWSLENSGLAWPFIPRVRFTAGATPRLWGISPGQGLVYSTTLP